MGKSDKSKHNICIAAIKRHTIKPHDFKWTKIYETNSDFYRAGVNFEFDENELIICSTVIDSDNYSILTTQRLLTNQNGRESGGNIEDAISVLYGDFKGYKDKLFTLGMIRLRNGTDLKYFIETGKASMVMIYGIRTLI